MCCCGVFCCGEGYGLVLVMLKDVVMVFYSGLYCKCMVLVCLGDVVGDCMCSISSVLLVGIMKMWLISVLFVVCGICGLGDLLMQLVYMFGCLLNDCVFYLSSLYGLVMVCLMVLCIQCGLWLFGMVLRLFFVGCMIILRCDSFELF